MATTSTANTAWRKWIKYALLTISQQIFICEKKLNKLLKQSGGSIDEELTGLTEKLKASSEDLQAALDAQGAKPETNNGKKGK